MAMLMHPVMYLESHVLMTRFSISKQIRVLQPTPDDAVSMGVDQLTCHVSRAWDTAKLDTYLFESVLIFRSRRTALVLQTWEHCKLAWNSERTISSGKNI